MITWYRQNYISIVLALSSSPLSSSFFFVSVLNRFYINSSFYVFVTLPLTSQPSRPKKLMCSIEILSYACSSQLLFSLPNEISCLTTCLENKLGSRTRIKIDSQTCNLKPSRELNGSPNKIQKIGVFFPGRIHILCPLLIAPNV